MHHFIAPETIQGMHIFPRFLIPNPQKLNCMLADFILLLQMNLSFGPFLPRTMPSCVN